MSANPNTQRGSLKVYLGYAPGVGKTFQMLVDGRAAVERGVELVLGYFEPHARPDTIAQATALESIPHRNIEYRGKIFHELDTDAVLRRKPTVVLVDELAHTNVPGSVHTKRWEDVQLLLDAGIEVWATMNVQHLESLNDQIWQITGVRVRETVPDGVVRQAAEIVAVDLTPEALHNRLKRGAVYRPEMVEKALAGFFKGSNLGALRELALRQAAHEVDLRQAFYDETRASNTLKSSETTNQPREHILVHLTAEPTSIMLIRRGRRAADFLQADCTALFVSPSGEISNLPPEQREAVEKHLHFARSLQITTQVLQATDIAKAVVQFAHRNHVTQIFVAQPRQGLMNRLLGRNNAENIIRIAQDIQVTVVADRTQRPTA
jgi:two-component system, OmpR family, sensor histidine kinase KdpD